MSSGDFSLSLKPNLNLVRPMRSTFKILFYINKNKTKADGTTAILCRITIDGANVVITTGENVAPND